METPRHHARSRLSRRDTPLEFWLCAVLARFLFWLAYRAGFEPAAAASSFGVAVRDPADLFYVFVKADRDLASALAVLALLVYGDRRALGLLIAAATLEPICDGLLVAVTSGRVAYALAVHGSAALLCAFVAYRLLRRGPDAALFMPSGVCSVAQRSKCRASGAGVGPWSAFVNRRIDDLLSHVDVFVSRALLVCVYG